MSTLGHGELKYKITSKDKKTTETIIDVEGGVVEVLNNRVIVLAEKVLAG